MCLFSLVLSLLKETRLFSSDRSIERWGEARLVWIEDQMGCGEMETAYYRDPPGLGEGRDRVKVIVLLLLLSNIGQLEHIYRFWRKNSLKNTQGRQDNLRVAEEQGGASSAAVKGSCACGWGFQFGAGCF
jgi:hypothetical protein